MLYVVQNRLNRVAVIKLSADLSSGKVVKRLSDPDLAVPTTIGACVAPYRCVIRSTALSASPFVGPEYGGATTVPVRDVGPGLSAGRGRVVPVGVGFDRTVTVAGAVCSVGACELPANSEAANTRLRSRLTRRSVGVSRAPV